MPRLLIAEDNADFASALGRKAEGCGWQVTVCRDGTELVAELATSSPPALLLIDINMPELDGIEAIQQIAAGPMARGWRIRFMTGGPDVNAVAARMIAGARDLNVGKSLFKPFSMARFAEELDREAELLADMEHPQRDDEDRPA